MAGEGNSNGATGIKVWVDGCFDLMHYGHANALRQAKAFGDYLVVGVHSDEEITKHKGPPVTTEEERRILVESCKWVDQVVMGAPYVTDLAVMDEYGCQICVHGDDITVTADGHDSYEAVKTAGRFVECKRTPSISTTELVGRMLLMSAPTSPDTPIEEGIRQFASGSKVTMFTTTQKLIQFSNGKEPKPSDRIVYIDGTFDLFHAGHAELLKAAKTMGDFLLVGIHDDATARRVKGPHKPILNMHERALGVLACRYVDEVILGAPYSVSEALLDGPFKVSLVVHGTQPSEPDVDCNDPYALPKKRGIYKEISTPFSFLSTSTYVERIIKNRAAYEERNRKKKAKDGVVNAGKLMC